jgi:hypothetical protein
VRRRGGSAGPAGRERAGIARAAAVARAAIAIATIGASLALGPAAAAGASGAAAASARVAPTISKRVTPRAHAAVVGGVQKTIEQLPWQVALFEKEEGGLRFLCGGAIRDPTHIVTAAHCLFDSTGEELAPTNLVVLAGVSTVTPEEIATGTTKQERAVADDRVHPYYEHALGAGSPDDVAVLQLAESLPVEPWESATAMSALELPGSTSGPAEGSLVSLSGFGEQDALTGEADDRLYSIGMALGFSRQCGEAATGSGAQEATREASALFLCASSASGSACDGDSGGAVLAVGAPDTLLGVVDAVQVVAGQRCQAGALNSFVNVAAPEIRDFIEGSEEPPRAPRGGGVMVHGVLNPGHSLTCEPGEWKNEPEFTYEFIDSASRQLMQQGSVPTYALTAADLGYKILCQVRATNAGGTGIVRTVALPPVEALSSGTSGTSTSGATPPSGGVLATAAEASVSRALIAAQLRGELTPGASAAIAASLLKAGGYTIRFKALEAGTAAVDWYQMSPFSGAKSARFKPILVADAHRRFATAGTAQLKVRLTAAGRRLLRKATQAEQAGGAKANKGLSLTAIGRFTPKGKPPVKATKSFVLK